MDGGNTYDIIYTNSCRYLNW